MNEHYGSIVHEDAAIFVIKKRAGVAVESRGSERDLLTELKAELLNRGEAPAIFPVHRLDQPVEGLLVVARTQEAADRLSEQIRDHRLEKLYKAVVHGTLSPDEGELRDYIAKQGSVAYIEPKKQPWNKEAVLQFQTLEQKEDRSLLLIRLVTGRFHQIRAQLAHAGYPIVGDKKYGRADQDPEVRFPALCACRLTFTHPVSGAPVCYETVPEGEGFSGWTSSRSSSFPPL